jgi:hypothetical protein
VDRVASHHTGGCGRACSLRVADHRFERLLNSRRIRGRAAAPLPGAGDLGSTPHPDAAAVATPPPPLAPLAPQPVARPCWSASLLTMRGSDFSRPSITGQGSSRSRCGPAAKDQSTGRGIARFTAPGTILTCQGRRLSRVERALALTRPFVWPCAIKTASAPWTTVLLRLSGWPIRTPPTLRRCPRGQRRTARGRCGSPLLHRRDLHHLLTVSLPGTLGTGRRTTDNGRIAVAEALRSSTSVKAGRNGPASLGCLPAPSSTLEGLGPLPRSWQVRRTSGRERKTWRGGASRLESSLALWRCPAAQGDPEKGEKVFNKCKPCHVA